MIKKVKPLKLVIFVFLSLISIIFFIYLLFSTVINKNDLPFWPILIFIIVLLLFSLIPFFLSLTYIIEDLNKTVQFDVKNQILVVKKKNEIINIKRKEIIAAYQVMTEKNTGVRIYFPWYKYAIIITNKRKRIFVTNLICNPEEILSFFNINYKTIYWNIPLISRLIGSEFLIKKESSDK